MIRTTKIIKRVTFFGDAEATEKDEHYILAKQTAKLLAKNGYIIVNGGGTGIMTAATLGAKEAKGKVETVVIDPSVDMGPNFIEENKNNYKRADRVYKMKSYDLRLCKLVELGDAFIIFKGGTGTLAELGLVWNKAKIDLGKHEPVIFFGKCWKEIIGDLAKNLDYEASEIEAVDLVETPEEVLNLLAKAGSYGESRWEKVATP